MKVERVVRECLESSKKGKVLKTFTPPEHHCELPRMPRKEVASDLIGPWPRELSNPYVLVMIDMNSKWPEVQWVKDTSS